MQLAFCRGAIVAAVLCAAAIAPAAAAEPDPIEAAVAQEWQALIGAEDASAMARKHGAEAIGKLLDAYRREKARADAAEAKLLPKPEPPSQ